MANEDPMVAVILRNQFYRRQYLLGFGVFVVSVLGLCALVMLLVHIIRNPVAPLYFATDNVGRLIDVTPVSKPNMTTEQAAAWTIRAVEQATSFDYVNYRRQMQGSEKYFTDYGCTRTCLRSRKRVI